MSRAIRRSLRCAPALVVLIGATVLLGCGPARYTAKISAATEAVERAREAGAPDHAPYEFYTAEAHLVKAREEAAEASYDDAVRYAKLATTWGWKARDLSRRRLRETGR